MTKFLTPKLRVQLESPGTDELTEYIVQTDNRDMVAFDLTRSRKGWPSMDEANMFWMTFLAHHALSKRGGVAIFDPIRVRVREIAVKQDDRASASGFVHCNVNAVGGAKTRHRYHGRFSKPFCCIRHSARSIRSCPKNGSPS